MPRKRKGRQVKGRPRRNVINDDEVGVYHVWSCCVRQAPLFGLDPLTGIDRRHRKAWFWERLEHLATIFGVEACVWATLSNHYHLIVRNRPDLVEQWSGEEVVRRWWMLCPERKDEHGRAAEPTALEIHSILSDPVRVAECRRRLRSISWFMKFLNEWLAKRSNTEDETRGHFFEDRFQCRNLLEEGAILACSIYVDLNEIRAALAATPEHSTNTSAYRRILARILRQARAEETGSELAGWTSDYRDGDPDYWLCPINERDRAPLLGPTWQVQGTAEARPLAVAQLQAAECLAVKRWRHGFLPVSVDEYLKLLDWTGRQVVAGKPGAIDEACPPILQRLGLQPAAWLQMIDQFETSIPSAAGRVEAAVEQAASTDRHEADGQIASGDTFT